MGQPTAINFWEVCLPGYGAQAAELLEWVTSSQNLLPLERPAEDLESNAAREVPWMSVPGILTRRETDFPTDCPERTSYIIVAEDLNDRLRFDLGPKLGDERAARLFEALRTTLGHVTKLEAEYLKTRMTAISLEKMGAPQPEELRRVSLCSQLRHDLLRNLFKLHMVTLAASIVDDPRYDCRPILRRWRSGNLLYGRHHQTGQMLYICA